MTLFGEELRRLRKRSGLSQETLAARARAKPGGRIAAGTRSPLTTDDHHALVGRGTASRRSRPRRAICRGQPARARDPVASGVCRPPGRPRQGTPRGGRAIERDDTRLLTLLGPAGVGKTRIAVGYAATQPARFPDGVRWFPIGTLNDPSTVLSALAGALGVRAPRRQPLRRSSTTYARCRACW